MVTNLYTYSFDSWKVSNLTACNLAGSETENSIYDNGRNRPKLLREEFLDLTRDRMSQQ